MKPGKIFWLAFAVLLLASLSCGLLPAAAKPTEPNQPPTQAPPNTEIAPPVVHLSSPAEISLGGNINYDVDSSGNAPEHRAPYGDVYKFNRLERPFTQNDMTYLPNIDINRFRLESDDNWYYIFIELIGNNPNDPLDIDYGVEIDKDRDGFGDILVWAQPPYTAQWAAENVSVYTDTNRDTGGVSAVKSDAPFNGNGYDALIFGQGQGQDPDLAWIRVDPQNPNVVELAFKKSLPGSSFMWSVWADGQLKDPAQFSYNDRFTEAEAGSPQTDNLNYPVKALYAVDSTCRAPFGFVPTGYEPLLCPPITAPETPKPQAGCTNPSAYTSKSGCEAAGCAWRQNGSIVVAVVYYCTYP